MFSLSKTLLAAVAAATLLAVPAAAAEIEQADRDAIAARIEQFNSAVGGGNLASTLDYMPARLLDHMASKFGMTTDQLKEATIAAIAATAETVTFESFGMDLDKAAFETTPDGSRVYGLIPTETVMSIEGGGKMRATSETLALEDGGEWYLIRVDEPNQVLMLKEVYPEFADVEFKPGTMEAVE
jgi:hypothetical protein